MSIIECFFDTSALQYTLNFKSKTKNFEALFRITTPSDFKYKPVDCYDGFIFGVILAAMEVGEDLYTQLPLSQKGLRNMHYLIEAWNNLKPDQYKKIKILTDHIIDNTILPNTSEAISAFSGGVDACFTLIRHNEKDWGEKSFNIKNVLCVQGFDVPINKYKEYDLLMERIAPIFQQYNCRNFKVWTDIREKSGQDWNMSFSTQLSTCLHLFSQHFGDALIGSSEPYTDFFVPWGSTPATDYLLSSSNMTIHHDGAGYSRTEKVERISKNDLARERVKVCWEKGVEENCGECEKCYRTRLNFLAVGYDNPTCFDSVIDLKKLKNIRYSSIPSIVELQSILNYSNNKNIKDDWVNVLKYKIWISQILYTSTLFVLLRRIKGKFF